MPAWLAGLDPCSVKAVPINAGSVALAYWCPKLGFVEGGLTRERHARAGQSADRDHHIARRRPRRHWRRDRGRTPAYGCRRRSVKRHRAGPLGRTEVAASDGH